MRALSLTQPWATAIAIGVKSVETRSWRTSYRGQIAIHAAKGFPKHAREFASAEHTLRRLPSQLPLGAIIAVATIADVTPTEEIELQVGAIERIYGDYSQGRFGWILKDVISLPESIPCRGALSLWEVPEDIEQQIREQLSAPQVAK
jgi:hypothetical protein